MPPIVNAVPVVPVMAAKLSLVAKVETCLYGQELCYEMGCSDQGGAEGRWACRLEQSNRMMPWGGHQEPLCLCPGSEYKAVASICLPGDGPQRWGFPYGNMPPHNPRLLSLSLLSVVSLLWVQHRTYRCTLTRTPHSVPLAQGLSLGRWGAMPNPTPAS